MEGDNVSVGQMIDEAGGELRWQEGEHQFLATNDLGIFTLVIEDPDGNNPLSTEFDLDTPYADVKKAAHELAVAQANGAVQDETGALDVPAGAEA